MIRLSQHRSFIAFCAYVAMLLGIPSPAHAEDIDIFIKNPQVTAVRPNVLIILDTSANWAATDKLAGDGSNMYQNVRAELAKTIDGLQPNVYRVGLMIYAETGTGNDNINGGVPRLGVRDLDDSNQSQLVEFFKTIDANYDKTNNTSMGLAFYEAFQYFRGEKGYAGIGKVKRDWYKNDLPTTGNQQNDNPTLAQSNALWQLEPASSHALATQSSDLYQSPISDACQKNFIIYIANGNVTDPSSNNVEARTKLQTAGGDTTTIPFTADDLNQDNISDEWTRFLANADLLPDTGTHPYRTGFQNIVSYTVEVNPQGDTQGRSNTQLLRSMATQGKGEYFDVYTKQTGTQRSLSDVLNQIFAQIIDRNSVFAASTLPVSSNVRGTFVNQVYMGVFRPDPNASPRWPGNLKQYKLANKVCGSTSLVPVFLADKFGCPIEDAFAEQGFVKPNVTSFWTTTESPGFWDPVYYPNTKSQSNLTAADAPDGAFVEKGGAAQRLRTIYATDVTTRNLFTCVAPSCTAGTSLSGSTDHAFREDNTTYIVDADLGITPPRDVTITRSGTTATATSAVAHGFTQGQTVEIAGAAQGAYNGIFSVSVLTANSFTFPVIESPASPATGTISASKALGSVGILSVVRSGTTATVTTDIPHGFADGSTVVISNVGSGFDGAYLITIDPVDPARFTYPVVETPVSPATTAGTAKVGGTTKTMTSSPVGVTRPAGSVVVTVTTTNAHGFSVNNNVQIAGVTPNDYNGNYKITSVPSTTTFTYNLTSSLGPTPNVVVGTSTASGANTRAVSTLTRSGAIATVVTGVDHGFDTNDQVAISGAQQSEYNGVFTIAKVDSRTFTYTVPVNPVSPATIGAGFTSITATGGGGVTRASLINWVRGANAQLDDNPNVTPTPSATRVRGYLHGDILHSRPAVVNYNRTAQVAAQGPDRDVVVYYGGNDGVIHAVKGGQDDTDGYELWGFVPKEFFNRFSRLYTENPKISSTSTRPYLADGPVSVDTVYNKDPSDPTIERIEWSGAKAQIFIGMRRGGRFYYSLDVTDPLVPRYKWKIDNTTTGFSELGQTWSEARVTTLNLNAAYCPGAAAAGPCKVIIFGGGYDAAADDAVPQGTFSMGRAIYVVHADTGALIWVASAVAPTLPSGAVHKPVAGMNYAMPATPAVINADGDVKDLADRIYAPDTGGNIWRVNIGDADPNNWTVRKVAALSGTDANQKRKFLNTPDVVNFDNSWDSILIGSGDRENPYGTVIKDRFYMIKDAHAFADDATLATVTDSSDSDVSGLCDLTANNLQGADAALATADKTCLAASRGWKIRMERVAGEKVVTGATTLSGTTIFGTSTPPGPPGPGQCGAALGKAYAYAVDFRDATAKIDWNASGAITAGERGTESGLGLPANPAPFVTDIDGKREEGVIIPPSVIQPSGITPGQRYRVFWNLSIDN